MKKYLEKLQSYAANSDRGKDAPETILEMLYDVYGEYAVPLAPYLYGLYLPTA